MPTPLPIINLSAASTGTKGTIDLSAAAPTSNPAYTFKNAIIQVYNDSGCGLRLSYRESGGGADLPAGAWKNLSIDAGEHFIDYQVVYFMANAPVTSLLATYYGPNEIADHFGSLGNSPIGLSSNVPLAATATAIANDGNPSGTEFVESSIGGVKHISMQNQGLYRSLPTLGGVDTNTYEAFPTDASAKDWALVCQASPFGFYLLNITDNKVPWLAKADGTIQLGNFLAMVDATGNLNAATLKGATGSKLKAISQFSGTGTTASAAHGLGQTPTAILVNGSNNLSTFGWSAAGATTVTINEQDMSSNPWVAIAMAF